MSSTKGSHKVKIEKASSKSPFFIALGTVFIVVSLLILTLTFAPILFVELNYAANKITNSGTKINKAIHPVDEEFGIVIPKIRANAKIIPNVDPYNEKVYQWELTKGVAHARGTAFPGNTGNVFLFAHSAENFYNANRYNAIFYLLSKMELNDEIYLYFRNEKYKYLVTEKKIVAANDVKYFKGDSLKKTVTLMTCWPAGTTWKRLIVVAEISN